MADSAKREKIAAARKKLKQFQKTSKPNKGRDTNGSPKPKPAKDSQKINKDIEQSEKTKTPEKSEAVHLEQNNTPDQRTDTHQQELTNSSYSKESTPVAPVLQSETQVSDSVKPVSDIVTPDNSRRSPVSAPVESTPIPATRSEPATASGISATTNQDSSRELTVTSPVPRIHTPTASTESLQQLSRQINGILAESPVGFEVDPSVSDQSILELETRNRELAALLAQHVQANEHLTSQNQQIRQHVSTLQSQLDRDRSEHQQRLTQELGPLKEQLQVHIQTIGILVAEKTELQSQVAQSNKIGEQRFGEVEDLTGRLKTSKQRISDLERTLASSNTSSQKLEQTSKESAKEIDHLKLELFKLNKSHEELKQNLSENQEKLRAKSSESSGLQHSLDDLRRRLEMAELYTQQLSSNQSETGQETLQVVEQMQQERDSLTSQLQQATESLQRVSVEKDQLSDQYKQYMEQLQAQNTQLTAQVTGLTEDREKLVNQAHDLEGAVVELQRKLEDVSSQAPSGVDETAHAELIQELNKTQAEYTELSNRHDAQIRDNAQLSRLLEEKEGKLVELETRLEELGDLAGDKAELLENIQSDKTALSRALTQNKDLKQQLAELQNGFVKMSNDNMEMLTQLQTEQHTSRDLQAKLASQEDEIKRFHEALSAKDMELQSANQNSVEANKVKLLHEQIQDRLRHYEAQAQLVETLQKELHSSQDMSEALTTQNSELRAMLIKATETRVLNPDTDVENAQREDVIDSLQSTIRQLELERNQLIENLQQQRDLADRLGVKVSDIEEELVQHNAANSENDKVSRFEYEKLKKTMELIQEKYNRVMRDKADLSDKADELEHMVLQLQGETETIGEYISLYHHQRALLQQREIQKNEYIKQLAKDREELQDKLGELQTLVMQLMGEKNMLHSYKQESVRPVSPHIHPPVDNSAHNDRHTDWPDYTSSESESESEVETIIGGKEGQPMETNGQRSPEDSATPTEQINDINGHVDHADDNKTENAIVNENMPHKTHMHSHRHGHGDHHFDNREHMQRSGSQSTHSKHEVTEDITAHKILNLLSEIEHSTLVDNLSFMEKQFHPCKYCKGRLQIL